MKKRNSRSSLSAADALFSKNVRARGLCWGQGRTKFDCKGNLQCAHIISRRYRAIRWDEDNAVALCAAHHLYWTHRPLEWQELWGDTYDVLRRRALNGPPEKAYDALVRLRQRG